MSSKSVRPLTHFEFGGIPVYCKHLLTKSLAGIMAVMLLTTTAFSGNHRVRDNRDEAINVAMKMREPLLNGNLSETERLGAQAIEFTEKALSEEKDADVKKFLQDAIGWLKVTLEYARKDDFNRAGEAWGTALKRLSLSY
jgi:hypothetical protein